jgi:hypothetical protein
MKIGVHQMTAPMRFFFFVQPDNEERFKRAMELAYMLWGGTNAPIFSFYEELPIAYRREFGVGITTKDYYKLTIANYDPDVIIFDEDIDKDFIASIAGDRQTLELGPFLTDLSGSHYDHAISILEVAEHLLKKEFKYVRNDGLKLGIPKIGDGDLLLQAFMGKLPAHMEKSIEDLFADNNAFERPVLDWTTMDKYWDHDKIDILSLNTFKVKTWANKAYKLGSGLYFLNLKRLQDIMNFWNLRAAGWQVIPIPVNMANLPYFAGITERFVNWAASNPNSDHAWVTLLMGYQIPHEDITKAFDLIKPDEKNYKKKLLFSYQPWFPRFWAPYEILDADHIKSHTPYCDTSFDHFETEGERLKFTPEQLPFEANWNLSRESAYKVILSLSLYDEYAEYAELLTGIDSVQLRSLTFPIDLRQWRLSTAGMHRSINRADDRISMNIPISLDFFRYYFANKSHKLTQTANSKLAKEVLKNIGGLNGSRFLLNNDHLKIIELFEDRKEIPYDGVVAEIKKQTGKKTPECQYLIKRLLEHKIIEMGATIKCGVCEQHGFFLPGQISEKITCPICRNEYDLPMDEPKAIVWSYRGIGPFSRNNKADGVMAVFAALSLFHDEFADSQGKISALIGFELIKNDQSTGKYPKEVDLGVILQNQYDTEQEPDLLFCECKTYKRFTGKDVERMKILGDEFPGAMLTIATLNESLDADEVVLISDLVKYFQKGNTNRPRNPILILTGKELLPEDYHGAFAAYKHQIMPYHRYNDFIGTLCELTIRKHLAIPTWGDLREQTRMREISRRQKIAQIIESLRKRLTA